MLNQVYKEYSHEYLNGIRYFSRDNQTKLSQILRTYMKTIMQLNASI